jgi:ketosteroid isomerase-like protein
MATHPELALRLRDERIRGGRAVIQRLFKAWAQQDRDMYLDCWHPDAVRTQRRGGLERSPQDLEAIAHEFDGSCERYSEIRVPWWVVENASLRASGDVVFAVAYEMTLVRRSDGIALLEEGREQYRLARDASGVWKIASNFDTYSFDQSISRPLL